jgi:hypothetical protein
MIHRGRTACRAYMLDHRTEDSDEQLGDYTRTMLLEMNQLFAKRLARAINAGTEHMPAEEQQQARTR